MAPPTNDSATILVVDDIVSNRETLRELLEPENYRLCEAADGATALQLAAAAPPDLVLLDVMMPGMDGFEVCRRLRANLVLAQVPIIMITALDDHASRLKGFEAGADDFVTKPFNRGELRARVRTTTRLNRYRRLLVAQTAQRVSEARYRALFDTMDEGFCVIELSFDDGGVAIDYRFLEVNPGFETQTGLGAAEGKMVSELVPTIEASLLRRLGQVALTGKCDRFVQRTEGLNRWFDIHAFRFGDPANGQLALLFNDITVRTKAAQALQVSEERFRALFDLGPVAIYSCATSGEIMEFNHRAEELWGRRPAPGDTDERFCGSFRMYRPDGVLMRHDECPMAEVLAGRVSAVTNAEVVIERPDGSRISVIVNIVPLTDGAGHVTGAINCFHDITERSRVKAALQRQGNELRVLLDLMPASIAFKDAENVFRRVNRHFAESVGKSVAELEGQTSIEIFPQHAAKYDAADLKVLQSGEPELGVVKSGQRDGREVWHQIDKVPVREAGKVVGLVVMSQDITARKLAEAALQLSEFSVNQCSAPTYWIAPDARILRVNQAACDLLGYSEAELLAMTIIELDPLFPSERWGAFWQESRSRPSASFETQHRRKNGQILDVEVDCNWIKFGGQEYSFAFARDISGRKRAETELRQGEERHQKMLMLSPDALYVQIDGVITFANTAFCQLLGATDAPQLVGRRALDLVHPDFHEIARARLRRVLDGQHSALAELQFLRLDGTLVNVEANAVAFEFRGRLEVQVIARDITARKANETALRESEQWLRALFEQVAVGVVQIDAKTGRFTRVNQRFCDIMGYAAAEIVALSFIDITDPRDLSENLENVQRMRAGSLREFTQEKRYVRKDGTHIWTNVAVSSIGPVGEKPVSFVAFVQDITQRRQAQEQMLRAQRLDNLGLLAAGIAHDFNNALAPIIMAGPLLRENLRSDSKPRRNGDDDGANFHIVRNHEVNPGAQRLLHIVEQCAERGAGLVKQLLSFARGASGERQLVQARHVLKEVGDLAEVTFPKSVQVEVVMPGELWPIQANATQLHQVLLNLCVNARDAMPKGGTLTLTADNRTLDTAAAAEFPDARPGNFLVVEVRDTGEGIAPDVLARIWDPFFTTKDDGKGTGLGLSTVRGIVQQHEGFVTVQSRVGHGTAFTVYLPSAAGTRDGEDASDQAKPVRGQNELILVVDDDESIRMIAAQILTLHGYRAITACDGADAIAVFAPRAAEVRLLLTDLQMPILGGPALATALRRIKPDLPIIAMSGAESRKTNATHKGFTTNFIAKPFQAKTLLLLVRSTLDAPELAAHVPAAT